MPHWWIDLQVIEPTERDQGIYSIVITDPENSHKRSLDLSGKGLSAPGLINTSSPEFQSAVIDHLKNNGQECGPLSRVKRSSSAAMETGSFWSQNNKKNNKKKVDFVGFNWFHRVDFFSCCRKCVNISQRKPQSTSRSSQFAPNIGALFSCSNIPLLTKLCQKVAYIYFHRCMFV